MDAIEKRALVQNLERNALAYELLGEKALPRLLRSAASALTPPEGYVLVPVEPTMEMLVAAKEADKEYQNRNGLPDIVSVGPYDHYIAMLAARPEVP